MDNPAQDIQQPYDTFIKAFFRNETGTLVAYFLKGATLDGTLEEAEQNVEIDRSMLKIDLAYWIKYLLLRAILHIELQSGPDKTIVKDIIEKELSMSSQYVDFMTQNPLFQQMLREHETKGEIKMILQLLHTHFSEATAELVELALRKVDIRDAEVIGPLKEAAVNLDEQGVNRWVKEHLPTE